MSLALLEYAQDFILQNFSISPELWGLIFTATLETLYMITMATLASAAIGIPLGVTLFATRPGEILECRMLNTLLSLITNIGRSIPFIILIIAIFPLTKKIVGSSIGMNAAILPLIVATIPFIARLIEGALNDVGPGLVEAAQAMGATPMQIIIKVLLPEARGGIINALTITVVTLIGYSAMAGAVGAGGLGDLGIRYGQQRYNVPVMLMTVVILVVMVQGLQSLGDRLVRKSDHK